MRLIEALSIFLTVFLLNEVRCDPIRTVGPSVVTEGKDALLTCVIMGPFENDTVIWRKGQEILAANMNRVTADKRVKVLHDDAPKGKIPIGGDVWVLLIQDTKPTDSDLYVCEVNSDPPIKSFHPLKVKGIKSNGTSRAPTTDVLAATIKPDDEDDADEESTDIFRHDYTECCIMLNVSTSCLGFCTIHNIMDGTTGIEPEICEKDFPRIVECMADGRNHLPCCEREKIPDLCQDMCHGEYTPFTDYVKSRVSCVSYTLSSLKCILEGVQTIPSPPRDIIVEPLNEKSLQVSWSPPARLAHKVQSYSINVSMLHSFDDDSTTNTTSETHATVNGSADSAVINGLKPFTMYSVTITANNDNGSSLPSNSIRTLTLDSGDGKKTSVAVVPKLPDIRGCCLKKNMTHMSCVDKMCDPTRTDFTEIPDLMVCAPWANITFSCLANKIDHSSCCEARGIPQACMPFCSGKVTTITFALFRCLQYMSEYGSCLMEGYGVLPDAPSRIKIPFFDKHFAVIEWQKPKRQLQSVTGYHIHLRKSGSGEKYKVYEKENPPFIAEDLDAGTSYEVFVEAANAHGKSYPSNRLIFTTRREIDVDKSDDIQSYNITACCVAANLLPQCMSLCTYDQKISDLQLLGQTCSLQMGILSKCAAGGRDHTPCCSRRGVPNKCLPLCRGIIPQPAVNCLPYGGNIIQCFEEGTGNIPGPVENVHATTVTNTSVSLQWNPNTEDSSKNGTDNLKKTQNVDYVIQYGKVNNMTLYETVVKMDNEINTTDTFIDLINLEANALYRIMVLARGEHGLSLPSSMLLINTTAIVNSTDEKVYGVTSPPHSLSISSHSATMVTVSWQPPEFSHPHESIVYRVFHKATADNETFSIIETRILWARIVQLKPNSQHVVYVVAYNQNGESLPSETLVAWTDPAVPGFVDPPVIQPSFMVPEGGNMSILCVALGNPVPKISLYVGGHLVREEVSRHMTTTIQNVTRDMEQVACHVDNGYGVPMKAGKRVSISFKPVIQPAGITLGLPGERVELKCIVKAKPAPQVIFWKDMEGKETVPLGNNYEMTTETNSDDISLTTMTLTILRLKNDNAGDYYCHAENVLGKTTRAVSVRMRNTAAAHNISECCMTQNVSAACMDACSFFVDIDAVKDRSECLVDFDKLMKCAADGSDHRSCCAKSEVPRHCLNWCRGEALGVTKGSLCVLEHTKTIIDCFQSERDRLPSPPLNLEVLIVSDSEALVKWQPPLKNAHMVEGYRVYWHELEPVSDDPISRINGFGTYRVDTKDLNIRIGDLRPNIIYELVVKAGNQFGSSILTDPIKFQLGDHHITSAHHSGTAGTLLGVFAGMLAIGLGIGAVLFYRHKNSFKASTNGGVSFENPSYMREVNMDNVQISSLSAESTLNWRPEQPPLQSAALNHHDQQLNAGVSSTATEVNPSLYDELKLGHKGAGFKRLVS